MQNNELFAENPKNFPLISLNTIWVVDSRLIAQDLGIEHKNLMETIRKYQDKIESNFGKLTFETEAIGKTNQLQKFCYLAENQAIFIGTLSRNTDEVVNFKIKLTKSFSEARNQVQKPMSVYEMIIMQAEAGARMEKELLEIKKDVVELKAKQQTTNTDYYALSGYYVLKGKKWDLSNTEAQNVGRQLVGLSKVMEFEVKKIHDTKHGQVNTYHINVLSNFFDNIKKY